MKHEFSTFAGNIKDSKVRGLTDLYGLIQDIQNPDEFTRCIIDELRAETNEQKRADLKAKLKGYTPAVLVEDRRRLVNIVSFSGLMSLDFDKLESVEYAKEFKQYLFNQYPFIYATWLSSSGKGVRALVKIPQCNSVAEYKAYYHGLEQSHMMGYIGYDIAPQNAVLPLFQSYDPDILYRDQVTTWNTKYIKSERKPLEAYPIYKGTDDQQRHVINIVKKSISKITDNGHPQLRAIAYALGGYVGGGYIDYGSAVRVINDLIESNNYLSEKPKVYQRTAKEMIDKGQSQPLNLPDNG